ncbi:RdgB/HAM1 family non-canonical purine NTP pyrophosphatase [Alkalinema sp. FACHB-956]|uniref:RdgB/HAM1 family non-canonical purine NTP pyrophosphatase n=1 Tax=Alkalinema sp. FACHB-956 TaxID=2692768 RepID=UPI0016840169|nr:RdgB/HAM1 family non-canonical purine NTP pyrophosphatase [Alkalinema sp. FACHB-956]MBD2328576.1 RdgB/HAM1 family non-canonical purine NTP pyrophosphatase [Alkalinema sp. FACHB-956]
MTVLVVATGNPGKLKEIQAYFSEGSGWELELKPPELDVEETGVTFLENACLKASQVALATGCWAIADDSGLAVDGLDGAPGVFSARYGTSDDDRIDRVLRELGDTTERRAQFICAIAVARPDGTIVVQEEGICPGEILQTRRGEGGFGYDPIFFVPEKNLTFAEMSPEMKHELSHRGRAFQRVMPQLEALLTNAND